MSDQVREVPQFDVKADGRTVEALIVPWDKPADILEVIGGRAIAYREQFSRGAFRGAETVPHRVTLTWGHSEDFGNALGRGQAFHDTAEGEVGVFTLAADTAGKARELIADNGLSVSFRSVAPAYGSEREGALVTRRNVVLRHVASVASPAYADARILAMREHDEVAAAAAAEASESTRVMVETLTLLRELGQELRPEQVAFLADHEAAVLGSGTNR